MGFFHVLDFMGEWYDGQDDCYAPSDYKSTDDFWQDGIGSTLDDIFNMTESMAEYEAEQEAEKEDVHEYVKGQAMNIMILLHHPTVILVLSQSLKSQIWRYLTK